MARSRVLRADARSRIAAFVVLLGAISGSALSAPRREARNLILVSIDTLRADRLSCYGNARPTSPRLDALATSGVLFESASAASPWTKPSHATLLTGLYPGRHGVTAMTSTFGADVTSIASWLASRGFRTESIVNLGLLATHGFERGFDHVAASELPNGQVAGSSITDSAIEWLRGQTPKKRFFLFLHYMDMHSDYEAEPVYRAEFVAPYDGRLRGTTQELYRIASRALHPSDADLRHLVDLYDASLRQTDAHLGRLFDFLRESGLLDTTLLVVTSDHGEEFLDHGGVLHGQSQYQELVRVPLVLHGPGVAAGRRFAEPVSLVDVVPTALGILGIPAPDGIDGVPLHPLWQKPGHTLPARFLFFEADIVFPPPAPGLVPLGTRRAVRFGSYKLHYDTQTQRAQLYDLSRDPAEKQDVRLTHPEIASALLERLTEYLARPRAASPGRALTAEQLEALRSLGYVGGP
jgi:arylsulfatase A-like enzyme